ncbi:MAG: hypothetical protein ACRD26_19395 [Vicinamibacterales bacterium]
MGLFTGDDWTLALSRKYTESDGILFSDFVVLCKAIYHEMRHAEQFYRIAQGLAAGDLRFPDTSPQQVTQAVASVKGATTVKQKAASFEATALQTVHSASRTQVIQKRLGIPMPVVQHAEAMQARFGAFAVSERPAWFRKTTVIGEVEDWMRSTYKPTLGAISTFAACHRDESPHLNKMYTDLAEEQDARALANAAAEAFQKIGFRRLWRSSIRCIGGCSDCCARATGRICPKRAACCRVRFSRPFWRRGCS